MRDYIEIASVPYDEECLPAGSDTTAQRAECIRFRDAIRAKLGPEVGSAVLKIKTNHHDFGTYLEVACYFDDQDEEGTEYAFRCESDAPTTWNDTLPMLPAVDSCS